MTKVQKQLHSVKMNRLNKKLRINFNPETYILNSNEPLTDAEFEKILKHTSEEKIDFNDVKPLKKFYPGRYIVL